VKRGGKKGPFLTTPLPPEKRFTFCRRGKGGGWHTNWQGGIGGEKKYHVQRKAKPGQVKGSRPGKKKKGEKNFQPRGRGGTRGLKGKDERPAWFLRGGGRKTPGGAAGGEGQHTGGSSGRRKLHRQERKREGIRTDTKAIPKEEVVSLGRDNGHEGKNAETRWRDKGREKKRVEV